MMERPFDLSGRRAFITGAASGIGRATAIQLANAGAEVVCADINLEGANETVARANEVGQGASAVQLDVTDQDQVKQVIGSGAAFDVLCNVAGILTHVPVADLSESELDRVLSINLKGPLFCAQAAIGGMRTAGRGSIINLTSAAIDTVAPNIAAYAMSKAAVAQLTKTMAIEWAGFGVRVNAVAPGFVDTKMTEYSYVNADGSIDEERRSAHMKAMRDYAPLGIVGQSDDIATAVLFLAADASRFMTGQILRPNGGIAMPW